MKRKKINVLIAEIIGWIVAFLVFILPFLFVLFNSLKDKKEANKMTLSFPSTVHFENYLEVLKNNDYEVVRAFFNSSLITILAVLILIIGCSMTGYVLQRRKTRVTWFAGKLLVFGLMVPVAVLPTLRLLQSLHIYKTMFSMVMIEAAINIPFTVMLYKGFMDTIPVTMEEAAWIDGCTSGKLFWSIIMPLLKPVTATVVILNAVTICVCICIDFFCNGIDLFFIDIGNSSNTGITDAAIQTFCVFTADESGCAYNSDLKFHNKTSYV